MMTNETSSGQRLANSGSTELPISQHKRCTICNVPFFNPDLISVHYKHHNTPKLCLVVTADGDGNQKLVELSQQQALAYSAGAFPFIQNAVASTQQQYILTDSAGNFKATTFDGGSQQLIATTTSGYQTAGNALTSGDVEMVHYIDAAGHDLGPDTVQYYTLDGQDFTIIQANEEIVVSTGHDESGTLVIEEPVHHQSHVQVQQPQQAVMTTSTPTRSRGSRAAPKRKNASAAAAAPAPPAAAAVSEVPKTYSRRGAAQPRGAKKMNMAAEQQQQQQMVYTTKVQNQVSGQLPPNVGQAISYVTSGRQSAPTNHLDLQHEEFLTGSSATTTTSTLSAADVASAIAKLKPEPEMILSDQQQQHNNHNELSATSIVTTAENVYQQSLKLSSLQPPPPPQQQQQQQQYIMVAYDSEGGLHQLQQQPQQQQGGNKASNSVTLVENFAPKTEKEII